MKFIRLLLFPIVPIYFLVTWCRNKLFDLGLMSSKSYHFPIICVGNLSTGGTGKTPMVEYLIRLLKTDYKLATLSRGYGRNTKGFVLANAMALADTLGDEPFQFYTKFKDSILVSVDENRQNGIFNLRALENKPNVIILDDAFQHRKVKATFNILLTTYSNLYCNDIVLPTGNLREPRQGASRAAIVVVTKCPAVLPEVQKEEIKYKLNLKPYQELFFSTISYAKAVIGINNTIALSNLNPFTLVTGIANAKPLVAFLTSEGLNFNHLEYKDHHYFTENEIKYFSNSDIIVTTEKDYVRLIKAKKISSKLYYLPITIILDRQDVFNDLVTTKIEK